MTSSSKFVFSFDDFLKEIKPKCSLKIIIFGPNKDSIKLYKKKCEIRDLITDLGHDAIFCEDILTPDFLSNSGLNLSVGELLMVQKCDYVVCLMGSPGVIGEVHDFAKKPEIAHKMTICIDEVNATGYSAMSTLRIFKGYNGIVDWFKNPDDLDHCHLATRIIEQIKCLAETKQWELSNG